MWPSIITTTTATFLGCDSIEINLVDIDITWFWSVDITFYLWSIHWLPASGIFFPLPTISLTQNYLRPKIIWSVNFWVQIAFDQKLPNTSLTYPFFNPHEINLRLDFLFWFCSTCSDIIVNCQAQFRLRSKVFSLERL